MGRAENALLDGVSIDGASQKRGGFDEDKLSRVFLGIDRQRRVLTAVICMPPSAAIQRPLTASGEFQHSTHLSRRGWLVETEPAF